VNPRFSEQFLRSLQSLAQTSALRKILSDNIDHVLTDPDAGHERDGMVSLPGQRASLCQERHRGYTIALVYRFNRSLVYRFNRSDASVPEDEVRFDLLKQIMVL
jgi:hypothetical protein